VAEPGQTIASADGRERVTFVRTAGGSGGEVLEYEAVLTPKGFVTREHLHPTQSERHAVVSGRVALELRGERRELGPGDAVDVPPGTPHRLLPVDAEPVHIRFETRPAGRTELLVEKFATLARDGKISDRGYPSVLQSAVIARELEEVGYPTRPPLAVQRVLLAPLAALGRRRGYRATAS
jgi:mannose-6-phosphate isomerase-like protein (cupin superfamily)